MSTSASPATTVGARLNRLSLIRHSVAGAAKIAIVRNVSPCRPTSEAVWARARLTPSAMPRSFQGKPVNRRPRAHSATPSPNARAKMRNRPRRPQEARERKSCGRKQGETRGQGDDRKRQRPGELVGLDQKRRADPPEAREKIAEAHPPAGAECGAERAAQRPSRPIAPAPRRSARRRSSRARRSAETAKRAAAPTPRRRPRRKAMARLRQPQDRIIPSISEAETIGPRQKRGIGNAQGIASPGSVESP